MFRDFLNKPFLLSFFLIFEAEIFLKFKGVKNRTNISQTHDLIDCYDRLKNISSMARTTGYTCASVVNILLSRSFNQKGVFTMEALASNSKLFDFILNYLSNRNIEFDNGSFE